MCVVVCVGQGTLDFLGEAHRRTAITTINGCGESGMFGHATLGTYVLQVWTDTSYPAGFVLPYTRIRPLRQHIGALVKKGPLKSSLTISHHNFSHVLSTAGLYVTLLSL
jgi:hypothetical protein